MAKWISTLHAVIASLTPFYITAQNDSLPLYGLGLVLIEAPSARTDTAQVITAHLIERYHRQTLSEALNLLPGVHLANIGARNESVVWVRGFDLRQVPVFVDGIPVYVPFDGYVDMGRFTTFDLAEIQVAKGGSSVLYGPNTLGGAINLVTRKPRRPFEANGALGLITAGRQANLNVGGAWGQFYAQLGLSHLQRDSFPLAKNFVPTRFEDGGRRANAWSEDNKINAKVGWQPAAGHEYSVAYIRQEGKKGNPLYAGADAQNNQFNRLRYWHWPRWNKESLYLIGQTPVGSQTYVKTRLFYDIFDNELRSYDDATYATQSRPYAFTSIYDDHTWGGSLEYGIEKWPRHFLKIAAHYKRDVHEEYTATTPRTRMADDNLSVGAENVTHVGPVQVSAGISYNRRASIEAAYYNTQRQEIIPFEKNHNDALNGQISAAWAMSSRTRLSASLARKTRFPTLKDRYSFRLGAAVPNPALNPENAWNAEVGYEGWLTQSLQGRTTLFYSRLSNVIVLVDNAVRDEATNRLLAQQQNAGKATFYGAEVELHYWWGAKMRTTTQYSFIRRRNLTNPALFFTDVPEHKVAISAEYRVRPGIWFTLWGEYCSQRYSTSYGTTSGAFAAVSAKGHVQLWRFLAIEAGGFNLLDRNYALVEGFPEPGRNGFVRLVFDY
jgi:iron complex outermembrane receptor protein